MRTAALLLAGAAVALAVATDRQQGEYSFSSFQKVKLRRGVPAHRCQFQTHTALPSCLNFRPLQRRLPLRVPVTATEMFTAEVAWCVVQVALSSWARKSSHSHMLCPRAVLLTKSPLCRSQDRWVLGVARYQMSGSGLPQFIGQLAACSTRGWAVRTLAHPHPAAVAGAQRAMQRASGCRWTCSASLR